MLKVSISEVKEKELSYFELKIIDAIKQLIAYNPTYDLKYLYEVTKSTMGRLIWNDYGIAFVIDHMFITRMSDHKYIAEITEISHKNSLPSGKVDYLH